MKLKNGILYLAAIAISALSFAAFADNLEIWDDTDYDSTFKISQGDCSATLLGKDGMTKGKGWSSVDLGAVTSLCDKNQDKCTVDLYMTDDCSGPIVATVTMDMSKGITSVDSKKVNGFFISKKQNSRGAFAISIIGGPSTPPSATTSATPAMPPAATPTTTK